MDTRPPFAVKCRGGVPLRRDLQVGKDERLSFILLMGGIQDSKLLHWISCQNDWNAGNNELSLELFE